MRACDNGYVNKKALVIILVVIVAIVGGGAYLLASDDGKQAKDQMMRDTANAPTENTAAEPEPASTNPAGAYVSYAANVIADTSGTKLLFFHAPWCPQCRAIEADIKATGVPSGVTIIKVDYDTNQKLRQKYGVTIQTTVVRVDDAGDLVEKFVAYDEPSVAAISRNLL
jgi:thiol-disulfide isomerase/thioredoxin